MRRACRLILGSDGGYWERNLVSGEVWFSDRFFEMLGVAPGIDGRAIFGFIHPDDRQAFGRHYQQAIAGPGPLNVDLRYLHADGGYRWTRVQGRVWSGADGRAERLLGTVVDVDAEKHAQLELQRLAERFARAMAASLEVHFERLPGDGSFFISPQINTLLGRPAGQPTPSREEFLSWVHPGDLPGLKAVARSSKQSPGSWHCEYRLRHADGSYRWVRARGRTEHLGDGRVRLSGMIGDIHDQRLAELELIEHRERLRQLVEERTIRLESALAEAQRQREQAERANEAKSTFLAHMSHEIRTPLNGLLGLTELALQEATGEQQRRYLKLALQSGAGLLDVLNGVLDFSRLNAGAPPSRDEPFDLAEALAAALRRSIPQARRKGLGTMYDYVGPVTLVVGDVVRLQQIVGNLLSNAVKFTDSGHVALRAEVHATGQQSCHARIEVRDTGPGMSADVAARIFEPFVQGDESLSRRHGGSGLGLSIARGLARSIGGDLSVETAPAAGACFRVELDLRLQPGMQPLDEMPDPGLAWLVYPQTTPGEWTAARLRRLGWRSLVLGMAEAIERARQPLDADAAPDLVVLAERSLDAPESLQAIRAGLPHTPVVLLLRPDWNQPAIEAAARANDMPLVFMPLTPGALLDLTRRHGHRAGIADSGFAELTSPVLAGADVLVAEDNPVNQLIITEMIGALGMSARLAGDGEAAVAACLEKPPELLLMDLQMPVVDGLEAARRLSGLQRSGQLAGFPIIALTAHASPQDRANCLAAGMQGYLTKPITLAQLRAELGRWLPGGGGIAGSRRAGSFLQPPVAADDAADWPAPADPG